MSNINFEDDQTKMLGKTENIQSLADQVERLDHIATRNRKDKKIFQTKEKKF